MKLSAALKLKNKLVSNLKSNREKIQRLNSVIEGTVRPFDISVLLREGDELTEKLISVKTAIHQASNPVRDKIFRLSELKSNIQFLNALNTQSGPVLEHYRSTNGPVMYNAHISESSKETLVKRLEAQIETLQFELEEFNHSTEISI